MGSLVRHPRTDTTRARMRFVRVLFIQGQAKSLLVIVVTTKEDRVEDFTMEQFHEQLTSLQGRMARQEAEFARSRRRRRTGPRLPFLAVAVLVALVPLSVLAMNPFTDLNPKSIHNANIDAIYTSGVTTGCTPTEYCPNSTVTREEMASFLARLGGLGDNKPVANAARLASGPTSVGGPTFAANDLVRVARAENGPDVGVVAITQAFSTFQDALTITITAPSNGFVLVNATVDILDWTAECAGVDCFAFVQLRHSQSGATSSLQVAAVDWSNHLAQSVAVTYVFPVSA